MSYYNILDKVERPEDLQKLTKEELKVLCDNIRCMIVNVVSENGGHLASNLGVVELTVALYKSFDLPKDKIIWDVGHQCYAHKILTGRKNLIHTIRTTGGISGFPKRNESKFDAFNVGHSSTSISAAFGIACAKDILGEDGHVIAVIGDGALTGGLAYEGLNNAGQFKKNFIVVLNDNKMSISKNVGSISRYLTRIRLRSSYISLKKKVRSQLNRMDHFGSTAQRFIRRTKSTMRKLLYERNFFEDMGFVYYGPIDGHNIDEMTHAFDMAKSIDEPVLIHTITTKGKGYKFAEKKPNVFHGIGSFDIGTGKHEIKPKTFSQVFGEKICSLANKNEKICAITAAMKLGTGLSDFANLFKSRFFDVGIAEGHAITFAAGLAAEGLLPFVAIYSSFLQRGYDQIIHDAAAQELPIVLAIDRAGIVGEDGETHQGVFDVAFLNSIPNVTIFTPTYFNELQFMLQAAANDYDSVKAIRYPRGTEPYRPDDFVSSTNQFDMYGNPASDVLIVTYGKIFANACKAKEILQSRNFNVNILKLNIVKPLPREALNKALRYKKVFFFEEGMKIGGISETFLSTISEMGFKGESYIRAIDNEFITQGKIDYSLDKLGLSDNKIAKIIKERWCL